jgi:hypothetical protein
VGSNPTPSAIPNVLSVFKDLSVIRLADLTNDLTNV